LLRLALLRSRRRLSELPLLAGSAPLRERLLALRGSGRLPWLARLAGRARLLRLALLRSRWRLSKLPLLAGSAPLRERLLALRGSGRLP